MAITTLDGWIAAPKQKVEITKTAGRTTQAGLPFSVYELAGFPGGGTLAGTSTTAGVVPTDATAGHPIINAFAGANTGYLGGIGYNSQVSCYLELHDLLWKGGAYTAAASAVTVTAPPSYSTRVPSGTDYNGLDLWVECVTAHTGILSVAITYTNQAGVAARTTGTFSVGTAMTLGRMAKVPLQAGDTGIQKIESVTSSVATAGTFNVLVTRPLWRNRINVSNGGGTDDFLKTGAPVVWTDSALMLIAQCDNATLGVPSLLFDIVNG